MVDFLKYKGVYAAISVVVILIGLFSILTWGYKYSIDFTGGTILEFQISKKASEKVINTAFKDAQVVPISLQVEGTHILARLAPLNDKQVKKIEEKIKTSVKGTKLQVLRYETVGPTLGRETIRKTLIASVIAIVGILIYMSFAFKGWNFALAAIAALFHDLLVVVGVYSLLSHFFGAEFDTLFVTALLTTMSFSVHDTIIIFDKIREYKKRESITHMADFANRALSEAFIRSLNNSMTILFMLLALVLLGGETIRFFVAALLIGTITGTYSSPFVATPILVWLETRKKQS